MKCTINVKHSPKWLKAQRLATGQNVHETTEAVVEIAELSLESREILLSSSYCGQYPSIWNGSFSNDYQFRPGHYFGLMPAEIDSASPSVAEIDAAIRAAASRLAEKRRQHDAEAARLRVEEEAAKAKLAEARELLKDELAKAGNYYSRLHIVSEFLAAVPQDALRGTLNAVANNAAAVEALRQKVEDASSLVVFSDDDEDDQE